MTHETTTSTLYEDFFRKQFNGDWFVCQLVVIANDDDGFDVALHHEYEKTPSIPKSSWVSATNVDTSQPVPTIQNALEHRVFLSAKIVAHGWIQFDPLQVSQ
ncbi:MAG: hypothetical protein WB421_17910 [Terriglobales bacterium]|jgi:hypothetical protein